MWNPCSSSTRQATGDPALDPFLKEIAGEAVSHNAQYWIERLAPRAESVVDLTLDRLVDLKILEHTDGEFWTLSRAVMQAELSDAPAEDHATQFVRRRISKVIFNNEIPAPRDVIIVALIDTCDVFRFMFQLDDETEERIQAICRMDLIGRSIAEAVSQNIAGPLLQRSSLTKEIPKVSLRKLLFNRHLRTGNIPALLADLGEQYGPVFKIKPPLQGADDRPRRDWAEPLGTTARTHVPESQGLLLRLRERLRSKWRDALDGWRRPFPASQGDVAGVLSREAGRAAECPLPPWPGAHG